MPRVAMNFVVAASRRLPITCRACVVPLLVLTLPRPAAADIVTNWNVVVADLVGLRFGGPQQQARVRAMVYIAVHDRIDIGEEAAAAILALRMNDGSDMPHRRPWPARNRRSALVRCGPQTRACQLCAAAR
jgi:hypothetical protein